ncbi:DEAD/DEAH box helicase [Marinicella litoralis]|uniref:Non-specific serine/threonine protein kinase n=1 Tax=Marinicella litoralis TaxID=644220 RepID=A0A4R6XGZ4_9GAMM|nr:DEAD/DEAH box helicase [Marinicella litoralis]TDR17559.1 non-specific serine/threonine protein kinase [Marinicella litoralis]
MLKTPISFKGPLGQLEKIFDEKDVFKAFKLLEDDSISHWRFNEESQISYATFLTTTGEALPMVMAWPIQADQIGTCQCPVQGVCDHLIALAMYNKSRLDLLPPFTQQVRALKNITQTFAHWLNQQTHDPFPAMARHRVIYVFNENEDGQFTVDLFKGYLSQEDQYSVKSKIDSSLIFKKSLPKFVSLLDQHVFHQMNQFALLKTHRFAITAEHEALLLSMLKTNRCFWRACYRPPLLLDTVSVKPKRYYSQVTKTLFFVPAENKFIQQIKSEVNQTVTPVTANQSIRPKLSLTTTWQELNWQPEFGERIDWAAMTFVTENVVFKLADVSKGKVVLDSASLEQVAGFCYQVEKLASIHAKYEQPISQGFDINDRYIPAPFTAVAPMLLALKKRNWLIEIDDSYRLNNERVDRLYIQVDQQTNKASNNNRLGWFDVEVGVKLGDQSINILPYLVKAIKTGQFDSVKEDLLIKLDTGQLIDMPKSKILQILSTLNELYDEKQLNQEDKLSLNQHQLIRLAEIQKDSAETATHILKDIQWLGSDALKLKTQQLNTIKALPEIEAPQGLRATLRPYQLTGLAWLRFLHDNDFHGILADDMGLGKTLQVLAHFLALKNQNLLDAPVMVVAPTSLLGNWLAEMNKFTPQLNAVILTGQHRKQHYEVLDEYDVVITSYGVMSRDYAEISQTVWHTVVLDEAQAIKNRKTQVAKTVKLISAKHRLCLSGTPMENHLGEIWSLFDFLMPGFLSSEKIFQKLYQWPVEKEQNREQLMALQSRLAPFILRRTKSAVAKELPDKTEIVKLIELTDAQADVYESIRITMNDEILKAVKNQQNNQILIGNALLRLRQVCCHPSLLKLNSVVDKADSAKLNWLTMVLPNLIEEGRRVLIFSSFTSMLKIIADNLDELNIEYFKLTGKTPSHKRTARIDAFQQGDKPVFLISLKAGGAGINLTAADTVIHFDPWWNPAAELQASDRAHRIGQDKQVFVYKLITHGTVEEKIHNLQKHKQELADNLLSQTSHINEILGKHQWQELLSPIKD